jgi:hypothetical protein
MNIARNLFIAAALVSASGLCSAQTSSPASARSPASSTSSTKTSSSTSPLTTTTSSTSSGTSTAPYTEGSVWEITMVRTKAGMGDDYIKNLAKNYKTVMDEEKKQNLVLSYKILLGDASTANDYNMLLMVEFKNMAALDGLRDKTDPIGQKIMGGEDQIRDASVKRAEIRDILGNKTMREITLK